MSNEIKVLKVTWVTQIPAPQTIGIVVIDNGHGEKKAYMGTAYGLNEAEDIQRIITAGGRIHETSLRGILDALES